MNNITKVLVITCCFSFLLQGCATIFSSSSQTIQIKAVDNDTKEVIDGCVCVVTDGSGGSYVVNGNPGSAIVHRSQGAVQVTCRKEDYRQLNTAVGDSFNATSIVNILFWPGFIVDAATGAYKKYPSHYLVNMEKVKIAK